MKQMKREYTIGEYKFGKKRERNVWAYSSDQALEIAIAIFNIPATRYSFTRKLQNQPNPLLGDNIHAQFNGEGTYGAWACLTAYEKEYKGK